MFFDQRIKIGGSMVEPPRIADSRSMINSQVQRKTCSFWNPKSMSNIILQGLKKSSSQTLSTLLDSRTLVYICSSRSTTKNKSSKNMQFLDFEK
jgi:hypothetical protein